MSRFRRGAPDHHPYHSKMDEEVYLKLQKMFESGELKERPRFDYEIPMHVVRFVDEDAVRTDVFPTRPDIAFPLYQIACFHDGPHHHKSKVEKRDREISDYLVRHSWHVLRFIYDGKYAKGKRDEVITKIAETFNLEYRSPRVEEIEL